jgi:hypothetical protein
MGLGTTRLGHLSFLGTLDGPDLNAVNDNGIWAVNPQGQVRLVVRGGDAAPGAGNDLFFPAIASSRTVITGSSRRLSQNASGKIVFMSPLVGPTTTSPGIPSVWIESGEGLRMVARVGDVAPGAHGGRLFESFGRLPAINDHGEIAMRATLQGSHFDARSEVGIWSDAGGVGLEQIVRADSAAVSLGGEARFTFFSDPGFNDLGTVAFTAAFEGADAELGSNAGIWKAKSPSDLTLVARSGRPAPGLGGDAHFTRFYTDPVINARDQVAFIASVMGPAVTEENDTGLWVTDLSGRLQLVAREGAMHASGRRFAPFSLIASNANTMVLNARGQIAFKNGDALWATDSAGNVQLVAHVGQTVDLVNGPQEKLDTIRNLIFAANSGNQDGASSGFNDRGELAFVALLSRFQNSAVFVSKQVIVPEPDTIIIALVAVTTCVRAPRRVRGSLGWNAIDNRNRHGTAQQRGADLRPSIPPS